jgi:hypothetical protein
MIGLGILLAAGCAGSQGNGGKGNVEGDVIVARGKVSARGSTPFSMLLLEGADGKMYAIESGALTDELRNLDGMDVSVRGTVVPQTGEHVTLGVISYEILALPSGETPIVGTIRPGGFIEDTNLIVWVIDGDFAGVLKDFVGAKVWVVGVPMESIERPEATYRVLLVTEYGVIRP